MLSFLTKQPSRTKSCLLSRIVFDGDHSVVEFRPPGDRYLVVNRLPPAASASEAQRLGLAHKGANSSLAPPLHRHFWQEETFHVVCGTAKFTIGRGAWKEERLAAAGEVVVIPKREAHTFCNASEEAELVIKFTLDPASRETDEAYFRNVWGYRDDCRKRGLQRSLFQSLLFMHRGGVVMALPGPEMISKSLGILLNYVGGALIGKMLGYQDSYPEYYSKDSP